MKNMGIEMARAGITGYIHAIVGGAQADLYMKRNQIKPTIKPDSIEEIAPNFVALFQYKPMVTGPRKQANMVPKAAPTISTMIPV